MPKGSPEGLRNADGRLCLLRYRSVVFQRVTASRKLADCWHCGRPIPKGSPIFAPMGNGAERYRRLHAECAEALAEQANGR